MPEQNISRELIERFDKKTILDTVDLARDL
jgi:hypothetical protein